MATGQSTRSGDLFRRHRVLAGLTQEALAEQGHLSAGAISALEQGVNHTPCKDLDVASLVALLAGALAPSADERSGLRGGAPPTARARCRTGRRQPPGR
jgi:transcriptional regulator with XRE-family HTH domain